MKLLYLSDNDTTGLAGAILFFVIFVFIQKSNSRLGFYLSSCILALCGGLTIGFSYNSYGTFNEKMIDTIIANIVFLLGVKALYHSSKKNLVQGYLIHGAWDIVHHSFLYGLFDTRTQTPSWYPLFCFVYDFAVAAYYYFDHHRK
ncbi:hypothetical protein DLAC_05045 [Tieghemostelium lacteum]|uniref:Transmembrane protein n=1 Tax=Tieghemostelium lacteum TaxID=361077 RepID=A0A151ZIF3_TIELA|nr:hypothetical protein DLAC_05045 [Tieghemostelium lacteum]|eukprot:KYQ93660.1 hypothetical protein DLAC_05045 [Tieghemostelium lacteum]